MQYAVIFFLLQKLTREIEQDMVRLVAVFDDMWFHSIRDTPNVPPCIGLHMFTHLIFVSSLGRWEAGRIRRHLVQTVQTLAGQENDIFSPEEVGCCAVKYMPVFHPLDLFLDVRTID